MISVSKKLGKEQAELNDIVSTLGGDYTWNLDSSCTHFIFQVSSVSARPEFLGVIDDPLFENFGVIGKFRGSELFYV